MTFECLNKPTKPDEPRQMFALVTEKHAIRHHGSARAHVVSAGTVVRMVSAAPNKLTQHVRPRAGHVTIEAGKMRVGDVHPETAKAADGSAPNGRRLDDLHARVKAMHEHAAKARDAKKE